MSVEIVEFQKVKELLDQARREDRKIEKFREIVAKAPKSNAPPPSLLECLFSAMATWLRKRRLSQIQSQAQA